MDDNTNNMVTAADTANVQAGGSSFLDSVGDMFTKGAVGAGVSAYASIYNTGVMAVNWFGADAEKMDVHDNLEKVDANYAQYYDDHKDAIDTAGFIAGSFIPGGLAIKGLNLIRRGEAAGAFARALNYTTIQQTKNLETALQTIAAPEGSIFSMMNKNMLQALAWGTADQVIQTAAFEVGVVATMKASPLLDGESFQNMTKDVITNALFGGVFGGTIEGFFLRGIGKEATQLVDRTQRKYDLLGASDKLNLSDSDTAYRFMDAALSLPKEVAAADRTLDFSYQLGGKMNQVQGGLSTGARFDRALQRTTDGAVQDMQRILTTNLAKDSDTTVSAPLARMAVKIFQDGVAGGKTDTEIRQRLGEVMFNLRRIDPIGDGAADVTPTRLSYFDPKAALTKGESPFLAAQPEGGSLKSIRLLTDDTGEIQVATNGKDALTASDAWEKGFDLYTKPDGSLSLNPKSKLIRPAQEPAGYQLILDVRNGEGNFTATPSIADVATTENPLTLAGNRVTAGTKSYTYKMGENVGDLVGADSTYYTGRHLWADSLKKIDGDVSSTDFSVLDKMSKEKNIVDADTNIVSPDGTSTNWRGTTPTTNFDSWVFQNKVNALKEMNTGDLSVDEMAYRLNTTPQWVQDTVASKYNANVGKVAGAPDLSTGWQRPMQEYSERDHVIVNYEKSQPTVFGVESSKNPMYELATGADGETYLSHKSAYFYTSTQAWQYRVKLAQDNLDTAFAKVFGDDAQKFMPLTPGDIEKFADRNPNGAGIVSFSNANYVDKLKVWSQETGKQTHFLAEQMANANLRRLQPLISQLNAGDKVANSSAAELTAIVTRIRRSASDFTILDADQGFDGAYLIDKALLKGTENDPEALANLKAQILGGGMQDGSQAYKIVNDLTAQFLKEHTAITDQVNQQRAALAVSRGQTSNRQLGTLYVPPVNTEKLKFFAFVRPNTGRVMGDDNVSMILARDAQELQSKASQITPESGMQVIYKKDTENFHKAKGDYDYQRALNESSVNSDMRKAGVLGDYMPSFDIPTTLEDFINYHQRQATTLVRDGVSTKYAQQIAEFDRLGSEFTAASSSQFDQTGKLFNRTLTNPYDDLIKGALDISKRSEFTLLHNTNEVLDALGTRAYRQVDKRFQALAEKGKEAGPADWEEANSFMSGLGLGTPFDNANAFQIAKTPADRNLLKIGLQKANMILSTGVLRLDFMNSLINTVSTPIMLGSEVSSLRRSIQNDPELLAKFNDALQVGVPGSTGVAVPSTLKLLHQAVRNYFGPDSEKLVQRYMTNGDINSQTAIIHEMNNDISQFPKMLPDKFNSKMNEWVDKASKVTFNTQAEQFTRFVSADVMRQITQPVVDAGKMLEQEQNAFISIFTNRVQGNYIASQRPILFQGTLGSAIGLFQTYQFNLLQQLFRHVENRDLKSAAVMMGLQSSVFGLNGLPFFDAINTNIIGNSRGNTQHKDAYSYLAQAPGGVGDWLLYGTASAFPLFGQNWPALYSRGDINPRSPTVIPTNPKDIPAVTATTNFVTNLLSTFSKIANGGNIGASILEGLEHNGINRPLAGLAQIVNGASTTGQGSLISDTRAQDLFSIANASRILGAKPLDEAVGLNTKFRQLSYQAEDKARLEKLGEGVKTVLRGNGVPSDDQMTDFMGKYAGAGGNIQNFGGAMQRWSKDANQSVLNTLAQKMNSPMAQRFNEVMGGKTITDYRNAPNPVDPTTNAPEVQPGQ